MATKRHHIRRFTTEGRKDGQKVITYCYSCTPCKINGAAFLTRSARDKAVTTHDPSFKP